MLDRLRRRSAENWAVKHSSHDTAILALKDLAYCLGALPSPALSRPPKTIKPATLVLAAGQFSPVSQLIKLLLFLSLKGRAQLRLRCTFLSSTSSKNPSGLFLHAKETTSLLRPCFVNLFLLHLVDLIT